MVQSAADYPGSTQQIDVGARTRSTVSEAKRYTKFVGVMKRVLTISALLLLGAVLAYALAPRRQSRVAMTFQRLGSVNNDLAMIKPKLTGIDKKGDPYVVTADEAIQDRRNTKHAKLKNVSADLTTKGGSWINVSAPRGFLTGDKNKLDLFDAVSMFTDKGYEAHTTLAHVDLNSDTVVGPRWVRGQGPLGTFVADKFVVERPKICGRKDSAAKKAETRCVSSSASIDAADSRIFLYGNVHMTLYRKRKANKT
ncbi:MAG: LPS export ABC transporter periplasmic protein LptC [Rhizomicrobium sp.]|jgi:lipopolysaccharide export system protein LptC